MTGSSRTAPGRRWDMGRVGYCWGRFIPSALAVIAAGAAIVVLATRANVEMLSYGVGIVPVVVPWLTALLAVAGAALALSEPGATSSGATPLMAALFILTAWSTAMLPFDLLRIVGLVSLPLSDSGLLLRLLLLVAGGAALYPLLQIRRARQAHCPACRRVLPGTLDRIPRWPAVVAVVFALPYPTLRVVWALGGTFGTSAGPLALEPALAWGVAVVGCVLVAFTIVLLIGRGPLWSRALLGLGGVLAGTALAVIGGSAAALSLTELATEGLSSSQGELMTWTFLVVYGSWFVAGLAVTAASYRYWARRREACPVCGPLLRPRTGFGLDTGHDGGPHRAPAAPGL